MVRIGNVWDSTTEVLGGRAGLLAGFALIGFFIPAALQAAAQAFGGETPGAAALLALTALLAGIANIWASLAIVGVASDPATGRARAASAAVARLPAALLLMLVLVAAGVLVVIPAIAVLAASGFDFNAAMAQAGSSSTQPKLPVGASVFLFVYGLAIVVAALWLYARMFPLLAVVLNERRGIGAFGRSWQLTRGLTLKLIGAGLLFLIVYGVAASAAKYVVFIVVRLLLGDALAGVATFAGALAAAVVGAVFSTVVAVFGARLWAAVTAPKDVVGARPA